MVLHVVIELVFIRKQSNPLPRSSKFREKEREREGGERERQTDRQTDRSDLRDSLGNRQVMRGYHGTIPQSWVRIHSIVSGSQMFVNLQSL